MLIALNRSVFDSRDASTQDFCIPGTPVLSSTETTTMKEATTMTTTMMSKPNDNDLLKAIDVGSISVVATYENL